MRDGEFGPDAFFFAHRGARGLESASVELAEVLDSYTSVEDNHDYWLDDAPQSMLIEEVEAIWAAIDERDDWSPLEAKVESLRRMGEAHGAPPQAAGHA